LDEDLTAKDTAHISIVAFGETATPVLELVSLRTDPSIEALTRQTATDYAAVFKYLTETVAWDLKRLASQGMQYYTPVIYFITDGNPQTEGRSQPDTAWLPLRQRFEQPSYPTGAIIVALGIGNVTERTVRSIASDKPKGVACIALPGATPGDLVRAIIGSIIYSIGNSVGSGNFEFDVPAGMKRLT
jgi:uncharacterized protein YegL